MQKLIEGIHHFQQEAFRTHQELFEQLSRRQNPDTLFITCSDSRIDTEPADAAPSPATCSSCATPATSCRPMCRGQQRCGGDHRICRHRWRSPFAGIPIAVPCAACSSRRTWPSCRRWRPGSVMPKYYAAHRAGQLQPGPRAICCSTPPSRKTCWYNWKNWTPPAVGSRLVKGDLHLHGWVYVIETGEVFAYEPRSSQFVPLAEYRFPDAELASRRRNTFEI